MEIKVGDVVEFRDWEECRRLDGEYNGPGGFGGAKDAAFPNLIKNGGTISKINERRDQEIELVEDTRKNIKYLFSKRWVKRVVKPPIESYTFRDDTLELDQICNEAFIDGKYGWLAVGNDEAFIGLILPNEDFEPPLELMITKAPLLIGAYLVHKIKLEQIPSWIKVLNEYADLLKTSVAKLNDKIKDRSRVKEDPKKFKVILF